MNEIDKKVREALGAEDAKWLDTMAAEPSLSDLVIDTFRGRNRWPVVVQYLGVAVSFGLAVTSAVQFFRMESTRDMIAWAMAFLIGALGIVMLKIWYAMELNKNALLRELKRVELQLALLVKRLQNSAK
jgi:hypothetical protein